MAAAFWPRLPRLQPPRLHSPRSAQVGDWRASFSSEVGSPIWASAALPLCPESMASRAGPWVPTDPGTPHLVPSNRLPGLLLFGRQGPFGQRSSHGLWGAPLGLCLSSSQRLARHCSHGSTCPGSNLGTPPVEPPGLHQLAQLRLLAGLSDRPECCLAGVSPPSVCDHVPVAEH